MGFWERVEAARLQEKTTYRWIAENVIHKSETTVSGWRSHMVLPRADDAVAIARALNVTVEWLVEGEDRSGLPPALVADLRLLAEHAPERFDVVQSVAAIQAAEIRRRASAEAANGGISG